MSWISTRWSRGFRICGLVALARSVIRRGRSDLLLDDFVEVGLGVVAGADLVAAWR